MFESVSIIYPVFNEAKRLQKTFLDIKKFEKLNKFTKIEYIFVNDGSSDETLSIIKKKIKQNVRFKVVTYDKNMGKGYALKRGVQVAKNDWVLTTDADCSVSNFQLQKWIQKKYLDQDNLIYFGSRNHPSSIVKKKTARKIIGMIFKLIIHYIYYLFFYSINNITLIIIAIINLPNGIGSLRSSSNSSILFDINLTIISSILYAIGNDNITKNNPP